MNSQSLARIICYAVMLMNAAGVHSQEKTTVQIVDLQSEHAYYQANSTSELVPVEGGRFVSILGDGSPGTDIFYDKKRSLMLVTQQLAEGLKHKGQSFLLPPLEISYWYSNIPTPVTIGGFYTTYPLEH